MTDVSIAYFITCHGFGHATRAAAVMAALEGIVARVRFELFTDCPEWIFKDSLCGDFGYHETFVDVGMVQRSPLEADLQATAAALYASTPFDAARVQGLAEHIDALGCRLIMCDISPLGLAVAGHAGKPGILVENFTWDWIYRAYRQKIPALDEPIAYFDHIYQQADLRFQTEPLCRPVDGAVIVPPVGRRPRTAPAQIRTRLGIPPGAKMVLVSMGGVPDRFRFLDRLPSRIDPFIVVPGAERIASPHPKVIALPSNSSFYHPDLLQAADLLIGKAGYSTVAEVYHNGTPFGYIARSESPESAVLERFIVEHLAACRVSADAYRSGDWIDLLPGLLAMPRRTPPQQNGADVIARFVRDGYLRT